MMTLKNIFFSSCVALGVFMLCAIMVFAADDPTTGGTPLFGADTTNAPAIQTANPAEDATQINFCSAPSSGAAPTMSVGVASASGTFVPVADQAVITNTYQLLYKECALRPAVNALRRKYTMEQVRNAILYFTGGKGGNPLFSQNLGPERLSAGDASMQASVRNELFAKVHSSFIAPLKQSIWQGYQSATRKPGDAFECGYQDDLAAAHGGDPEGSIRDALASLGTSPCNPIIVGDVANLKAYDYVNTQIEHADTNLAWGQGILPITKYDANGNVIVTTPASIVREMMVMYFQSGYKQQEMANNVGEMVNSEFAHISSQIFNNSGVPGLLDPVAGTAFGGGSGGGGGGAGGGGGGMSYLDSAFAGASGGVGQVTTNAIATAIINQLTIEQDYQNAERDLATRLASAADQLKAREAACWSSQITKICTAPPASGSTSCTDSSGATLTHVPAPGSTQFSQPVIDSKITPLAAPIAANLTAVSAVILQLIQIQNAVTTNDPTAQAAAVAQFNALGTSGAFHTPADVAAVNALDTGMDALLTTTNDIWTGVNAGGSTVIPWDGTFNPGTGWCNDSPATLSRWATAWK
jgi:hypothetical protein